jgi:hypothetical protein
VPPSSGPSSKRIVIGPEGAGTTLFRNVGICLLVDTVKHPRRVNNLLSGFYGIAYLVLVFRIGGCWSNMHVTAVL